jgi:hypothetical protein
MASKKLLILFLTFIPLFSVGQTLRFEYDAIGNRISRTLIPLQLKSGNIGFPITDPDKLELPEKETFSADEAQIKIYPNPTKGILRIEITNCPGEAKIELSLFDLSGSKLMEMQNLSPVYNLDISNRKNGIYILKVFINNRISNWKIIKN